MSVLDIIKYPEDVLSRKASEVTDIDRDLQTLIDNMIETMYAAPGIGLAAPQVGVSKRLVVVDVSPREEEASLLVLLNPVILMMEGEVEFEEGCLSLPDYTAKIRRAERVKLGALDREGRQLVLDTEGLLAIALQHEIDHLEGRLIIDRISPLKREFFKKRFRKLQKSGK